MVHVKDQTCTLLIITWWSGRNCPKLVFKPLAAKKDLSISVLFTAPFLQIIPVSVYMVTMCALQDIFKEQCHHFWINWNEKWCSKFNTYTDHGPETCSWKFQFSCCLHTAEYRFLFEGRKVFEYHIKTDLLNLELKIRSAKDWRWNAVLGL